MAKVDAIFNVRSFDKEKNPHIQSLFSDKLWGLSPRYKWVWEPLDIGSRVLFHGDKGLKIAGIIENKFKNDKPVKYWTDNPTGYPYQFKIKLLNTDVDDINPIYNSKLVKQYNIMSAKSGFFRTSAVIFPDEELKLRTKYKKKKFDRIWNDFTKENKLE